MLGYIFLRQDFDLFSTIMLGAAEILVKSSKYRIKVKILIFLKSPDIVLDTYNRSITDQSLISDILNQHFVNAAHSVSPIESNINLSTNIITYVLTL